MAQKFTVPITVKQLTTAGSDAITVYVDQDTYARLKLEAGGRLTWGPGASAGDVNLYRDAADVLKTDDTFKAAALFVDGIEIDPTGATTNQVLKFNGTKFVPDTGGGAGATSLDGLTDVAITSPEKYQTIVYDGTSWINEFPTTVSLVNNAEATTLQVGEAVYLFGNTGNHASVKRADNDGDATSAKTVGLVAEAIPAGGNGPVVTRGYVTGVNLSVGYTAGQTLYLGENGGFTTTKPHAPEHLVYLGVVVRATNNGIIYVAAQNGYELDEIHDVDLVTTPPTSGDFLKYNGTLWVNDKIDLGTDTTGNYVSRVSGGTGISVNFTPGENVGASVSLNATIDQLNDVTAPSPSSGDFLKWNGSAWVNDSIDLGTDTTGNYMVGVTAGTGISVTHTPGEGSTATVGLNATLDDLSNVTVTGASAGNVLTFNGSIWTAASAGGGGASVTVSDTPPASPTVGDLWFESDTTRTYVYYDSFWVEVGSTGAGATTSDTAPTNPVQGQFWFNSLNGATYVYYGTVWLEVGAVPVNTLLSTIQAKGDLLVGTAAASVDNLGAGTTGQVLTVDPTTATGLKWAAIPPSGGLNTATDGALFIMDIGV